MPFVAIGYTANPKAPIGKWVCSRISALGPYEPHLLTIPDTTGLLWAMRFLRDAGMPLPSGKHGIVETG
ncbi:hypothetical protein FBZ90_107328 [Nitrospirillum pindoramense]|uniref:Uncharacterized protein n=1 Tax=Nitrospirillum amazonense TaxID=28077 RepID=A0A560H816_9PROT|nr:hypothetical protein FBZ90_107328 [Nitrospirillum amazonense]